MVARGFLWGGLLAAACATERIPEKKIEPPADLVVLDHNLFEIPAGRIHTVKVMRTLLEGATVYRASSGP